MITAIGEIIRASCDVFAVSTEGFAFCVVYVSIHWLDATESAGTDLLACVRLVSVMRGSRVGSARSAFEMTVRVFPTGTCAYLV